MELDYARDVRCDVNHLHYEWMRQPELVWQYGEELAKAKQRTARAKENVDVIKAQAYRSAKEVVKSPADAVLAERDLDPAYLQAVREFNDAAYEQSLIQVGYDAISSQKKASLEKLVQLHGQEYFATPVEQKDYERWKGVRFTDQATQQVRQDANENARAAGRRRRERTRQET